MKRKINPIIAQYERERKRVSSAISRERGKGYNIPKQALPPRPKRITQGSVNRLKAITPAKIRKLAAPPKSRRKVSPRITKVDMVNDDRKQEKQYPQFADVVLSNIEELIDRFPDPYFGAGVWTTWQTAIHEHHHTIVKNFLQAQIAQQGRTRVAVRLEAAVGDVVEVVKALLYADSNDVQFQADMAQFTAIIKGSALTQEESEQLESVISAYEA